MADQQTTKGVGDIFADHAARLVATAYNLTVSGALTRKEAADWLTRIGNDLPETFQSACEVWDQKSAGMQH